jgi:hypothetical protein
VAEYTLIRAKREWVPDWLWRVFCIGNLATWQPFTVILTCKPQCRCSDLLPAPDCPIHNEPIEEEDRGHRTL